MDFSQVIERHMRELQNDLSSQASTLQQQLSDQVANLQQQLANMQIVNEYLQDQSRTKNDELVKLRTELKERDENVKATERRVICLIDGDGYIFASSYLRQGKTGGRLAAQKLAASIHDNYPPAQYQSDAADGLESFLWGFNQSADRFLVVDVGDGKEAVDCKMRAYLEDEAKSIQTVKIIFGGCHDHGYLTTISGLITAGYKQKLVLLPGYADMAVGYQSLDLPKLQTQDLFEHQKLNTKNDLFPAIPTTPVIPASPPGLSTIPTARYSPTESSPDRSRTPSKLPSTYTEALRSPSLVKVTRGPVTTQPRVRYMDPNKPVNQQDPPPCNLFYLANTCKKGVTCRFAHDYALKPEDYEEMRQNAKKAPCTAVNSGEKCPFGDSCCYGHKCPYLSKCYFFKMGTCRFIGAGMHAE